MTLSSAMRTSTMNIVNGPVSAIWAPSHRSKSLFKVGLELDQRRWRHVALERLQERMAPVGFVPGLEGAKFHQRVRGGIRPVLSGLSHHQFRGQRHRLLEWR